MAKQKGIKSLKETVPDSEIIRNGEVKNAPNYPFKDGLYGISGGYRDYSLVKKRIAYRTGTEEDDEYNGKVIEYTTWEDVPCYIATIEGIFKAYAQILNLTEFKSKKMTGEISELVSIHQHTQDIITEELKTFSDYLTKEQKKVCDLTDTIVGLEHHIKVMEERLNKYKKLDSEIDRMYNTIKEKTTIIVNRDKPKNHRNKPEEN